MAPPLDSSVHDVCRGQLQELFSRQDAKLAKKDFFVSPNLGAFASLRESPVFPIAA
jgi:hypothetical protein